MVKAFVAFSKDDSIIKQSSSGGVFYHIAKRIINNGGVVFGVAIDKFGNAYHKGVQSIDELDTLLKSKYVESVIGNTYKEVLNFLSEGRQVLYSGTPCQIAGLRKITGDNRNLILVDLICHGVPDRKYWKLYLESIDDKPPYFNIDFRNKNSGWDNYSIQINDSIEEKTSNKYLHAFLTNTILCKKCYTCRFKGENRCSDIVLGDAWGVNNYSDVYNNNGTSLVIQRSNKFDFLSMKDSLVIKSVDYSVATYYNSTYLFSVSKPLKPFTNFNDIDINNAKARHKTLFLIIKGLIKSLYIKMHLIYKISRHSVYDIGVVTCYGFFNFGNKLQNYALHHILRENGYKTINMIPLHYDSSPWIFAINSLRGRTKRECCIYKASLKYEKKYIPMFACPSKYKNIKKILVGSDQVWNYNFNDRYSLGVFFERNDLNSYAASFGVGELDSSLYELYKQQFSKYKNLSVREKTGQLILNKLGFDSSLDLDPTLLLDVKQWQEVIKKRAKKRVPKEDYCVYYMLRNTEYSYIGDKINTIKLLDKDDPYYASNQFDFVNIIFHSRYVVTDSFHATVFSLISNKKVFVLHSNESNKKMFSRFETLMSLCNSSKIKKDEDCLVFDENALNYDKLKYFRQISINRLLKMFNK